MEMIGIWTLCFLALSINIPLGYWRVQQPKFSLNWFVAVHLSVPIIYGVRVWALIDYHFIPLLIISAVAGQILGGLVFSRMHGL